MGLYYRTYCINSLCIKSACASSSMTVSTLKIRAASQHQLFLLKNSHFCPLTCNRAWQFIKPPSDLRGTCHHVPIPHEGKVEA